MYAFVFQSDRLTKGGEKVHLGHLFFDESELFRGDLRFCSFSLALVVNYFKFLFFRVKCFLIGVEDNYYRRRSYCTNSFYKHVLMVEWGVYDSEGYAIQPDGYGLNLRDPERWRFGSLFNYRVSSLDITIPIHKTHHLRYYLWGYFSRKNAKFKGRFFFHFNYLLPVDVIDYQPKSSLFVPFSSVPVPFSIKYPLLFELLVLKFNVFSFFFSTSYAHVYEFYSGGLFESILICFRNILDIVWYTNLNKFWKDKEVSERQLELLILKFNYCNFRNFYSFGKLNFKFIHTSIYYNKLKYEWIVVHLKPIPVNFLFFVLKSLLYLLFLYFVCFFDLLDLIAFVEISLFFRWNLIVVLFILIFFLLFFYFIITLFVGRGVSISIKKKYLQSYPWLWDLPKTFIKIRVILFFVFSSFFEAFFCNLVNIGSFFILIVLIYKLTALVYFYSFLVVSFLFFLFALIDNIVSIVNKYFFYCRVTKSVKDIKFSAVPLILFFPFLMFLLFPILYFFINSILSFINILKTYMPNYPYGLLWSLQLNLFRAPFLYIRDLDGWWDRMLLYDKNPLIAEKSFRNIFNEYYDSKRPFDKYDLPYFFKFLVDRKGRLFELQYNYFNYEEFLKTNRGYESKTCIFFPPKVIYIFLFFNLWVFWVIINFKPLLLMGLSFSPLRYSFWSWNFLFLKNIDFFSEQQLLAYNKRLKNMKYKNIIFSLANLKRTTFVDFDSFLFEEQRARSLNG